MGNTLSFTAVRAVGNGIATILPTYTKLKVDVPSHQTLPSNIPSSSKDELV